ncbi:MAG: gephyrin-like molybdotransferase Glp [Prochlorotrichaceae cyanobacterium]|jgi:molybdopterin molybdotransferase
MLSAIEAETKIRSLISPLSQRDPATTIEVVPLSQALGRILAQAISSDLAFPHWDNSAMDGYAVRYADVGQASTANPVSLAIVERIPAGQVPQRSLQPGETARIFTGSMLPPGADTIVPQEDVDAHEHHILVNAAPRQLGAFVRRQGEYYQSGDPLLKAGLRLSASDLGILAAAQCRQIPVYRSLRVGLFSTGNELVPLANPAPLAPGKLIDSNQVALEATLHSIGITPVLLGIVPDDPVVLQETIAAHLPHLDVLISSGGVSMGDYDYIDRILLGLGAEFAVRSVAVKPGKPLTVAKLPAQSGGTLYFGLPGNPVSALVSFWRFVQPALEALSGWVDLPQRRVTGYTTLPLQGDQKREVYLWGRVAWHPPQGEKPEGYWFTPASGSKSSGNLIHLSQVNALAVLPAGERSLAAGAPLSLWCLAVP